METKPGAARLGIGRSSRHGWPFTSLLGGSAVIDRLFIDTKSVDPLRTDPLPPLWSVLP